MFEINTQKLKSGLTVITVPMQTESVTILTIVHAGSRDEEATQYGGAHFLEHFVFKGTKKYPGINDINFAIDNIGGMQNAFTSTDYTGYWVKVAKDKWQTGLEVVAQMITEPLLPEKELEKEKGTIVEELRMYEDNHRSKTMEVLDSITFPDSPLGRPIIGFETSINAMKTSDMIAFRNRWYYPQNMVVIVVGGITAPQKLLKEIEEQYDSISENNSSPIRIGRDQIFTQTAPVVKLTTRKIQQGHLAMGFRTMKADDERWYVADLMNEILGGSSLSSRLYQEVREKRGLVYYVKMLNENHTDASQLEVIAGVKVEKIEEAVKVLCDEMEKIGTKGVADEELKRGKSSLIGRMKLDLEDSQDIAMLAANDWVMRNGQVRQLSEIIKKLESVTAEEIKSLGQELFDRKMYNLSIVGPFEDPAVFEKIIKGV